MAALLALAVGYFAGRGVVDQFRAAPAQQPEYRVPDALALVTLPNGETVLQEVWA